MKIRSGAFTALRPREPAPSLESREAGTGLPTRDAGFEAGGVRPSITRGAAATSLLTERLGDGSTNCLEHAARWVALATPALRARSELIFLRDLRPSHEGASGHVVIRQGTRVLDPATGRSHESLADCLSASPHYREAGTLSAVAAAKVFEAAPGKPRELALAAANVSPELGAMLVADAAPAGANEPGRAARDAKVLHDALSGRPADAEVVLGVLEGKSREEISLIEAEFVAQFGRDLRTTVSTSVEGVKAERIFELIFGTPDGYRVATLEDALDGWVVDEAAVMKLLEEGSPESRRVLAAAFKRRNGESLLERLEGSFNAAELERARQLLDLPGVDLADPPPDLTWGEWLASQTTPLEKSSAPVFVDGPSADDVTQGALGDCYLLASLAALAQTDPEAVRNMVRDNHDGTFTVTFYERSVLDRLMGRFAKVEVTVDADFYTNGSGTPYYAKETPDGEKWVALVEKAYAQHWGGYDDIGGGGLLGGALSTLTGRPTDTLFFPGLHSPDAVWATLTRAVDGKNPVAAGTLPEFHKDTTGTGLAASHAYSVLGYEERDGQRWVILRNPHGSGEGGDDGVNDGVFRLPLEDFVSHFSMLTVVV
ncbi:MAG: hypothetical protein JNK82_16185 [Myxococcaceae bacterium]|nr:hypothetical protein [Myxococcaceae bacterium]